MLLQKAHQQHKRHLTAHHHHRATTLHSLQPSTTTLTMSQGRSNRSNPGLVTPDPPAAYFGHHQVSWRSQQHSTTTATSRQQRSLQPSPNATTRSTTINRNQRTPASSLHYPSMHPDSLQSSRSPYSATPTSSNTPQYYWQSTMEEYRYTPYGESRYPTNQPT